MNAALLDHACLRHRDCLRATVRTESALHVGVGSSTEVQTPSDMPVARDGHGRPYIPGSSLRGALRSGIESLLLGLPKPPAGLRVCNPLEDDPKRQDVSCSKQIAELRKNRQLTEDEAFEIASKNTCAVCAVFGHSFLAARLRIADLTLAAENGQLPELTTDLRNGVGIDRDLRTAVPRILYDFEAVPAGTAFRLRMDLENAAGHELGLLLSGLELFNQGFFTLGGKRACGVGQARIEEIRITRWRAEDFFQAGSRGRELEPTDLESFAGQARKHYLQGES